MYPSRDAIPLRLHGVRPANDPSDFADDPANSLDLALPADPPCPLFPLLRLPQKRGQ
jgi:hypothetical protein